MPQDRLTFRIPRKDSARIGVKKSLAAEITAYRDEAVLGLVDGRKNDIWTE